MGYLIYKSVNSFTSWKMISWQHQKAKTRKQGWKAHGCKFWKIKPIKPNTIMENGRCTPVSFFEQNLFHILMGFFILRSKHKYPIDRTISLFLFGLANMYAYTVRVLFLSGPIEMGFALSGKFINKTALTPEEVIRILELFCLFCFCIFKIMFLDSYIFGLISISLIDWIEIRR